MVTNKHDDRRGHTRVDFQTRILLNADGIEIDTEGSSKDLSLKGVFVNSDYSISPGTQCSVKILLSGGIETIELNMKATVARDEAQGLGISFDSMDLDSYTHLKNIVRYNSDSNI